MAEISELLAKNKTTGKKELYELKDKQARKFMEGFSENVETVVNTCLAESLLKKIDANPVYTFAKKLDSSGTVDTTNTYFVAEINCKVGDRFRISVPEDYVIGLCYESTITEYHTRLLEIVADKENMIIQFRKLSNSYIYNSNGIEIKKIIKKNETGYYDFVVAAYDSTDEEKAMADIVCDGINDEIELNCAVNCNITCSRKANVLLLSGHYNIDSFLNYKNLGFYYGMCILPHVGKTATYEVLLSGKYPEYAYAVGGTYIHVTQTAYESIDSEITTEYAVFGACRYGTTNLGVFKQRFAADVKNICIKMYDVLKPCVGIDGAGLSRLSCENVNVTRLTADGESDISLNLDTQTPVIGLIGIRGVHGSNRGNGNYIKSCRMMCMYEGLALTGEHFVIQDTLMHHCVYGFTIGNYAVATENEHPNVFIGCSVEQCVNFALLNRYGATEESEVTTPEETFIYIGGSVENTWKDSEGNYNKMNPIKEVVKGAYIGRFESDFSTARPIFAADGSGKYIDVRNTSLKSKGTTDERTMYTITARQEGESYYDTTLGKIVYVHDGKWVDATGTAV